MNNGDLVVKEGLEGIEESKSRGDIQSVETSSGLSSAGVNNHADTHELVDANKIVVTITGHSDTDELASSVCYVPISVGKKDHLGARFRETVAQLENYKSVVFVVCDSLQRYAFQIKGYSEEKAREAALNAGRQWEKESVETLRSFTKPYKIVRWDEFLSDTDYPEKRELIQKKYDEKLEVVSGRPDVVGVPPAFWQSVDGMVWPYLAALKDNKGNSTIRVEEQKAFELSRECILEEAAVAAIWQKDPEYKYVAYPVNRNIHAKIVNCLSEMCADAGAKFLSIDIAHPAPNKVLTKKEQRKLRRQQLVNSREPQAEKFAAPHSVVNPGVLHVSHENSKRLEGISTVPNVGLAYELEMARIEAEAKLLEKKALMINTLLEDPNIPPQDKVNLVRGFVPIPIVHTQLPENSSGYNGGASPFSKFRVISSGSSLFGENVEARKVRKEGRQSLECGSQVAEELALTSRRDDVAHRKSIGPMRRSSSFGSISSLLAAEQGNDNCTDKSLHSDSSNGGAPKLSSSAPK